MRKKLFKLPRAFLSFDYDNNKTEKNLFAGQIKLSASPINIEDWSSKTHLPQKKWEEFIYKKINKCNMLIVLVGYNTHKAEGVVKEIQFAKDQSIPVFGVYLKDVNSRTALPLGLKRNRTISWKWDNISVAIDQMMEEGKNIE